MKTIASLFVTIGFFQPLAFGFSLTASELSQVLDENHRAQHELGTVVQRQAGIQLETTPEDESAPSARIRNPYSTEDVIVISAGDSIY